MLGGWVGVSPIHFLRSCQSPPFFWGSKRAFLVFGRSNVYMSKWKKISPQRNKNIYQPALVQWFAIHPLKPIFPVNGQHPAVVGMGAKALVNLESFVISTVLPNWVHPKRNDFPLFTRPCFPQQLPGWNPKVRDIFKPRNLGILQHLPPVAVAVSIVPNLRQPPGTSWRPWRRSR